MIALYIILAIIALIALILSLRIKLNIVYDGSLSIYYQILCFKIKDNILKGINLDKNKQKKSKDSPSSEPQSTQKPSSPLEHNINIIKDVVLLALRSYRKHLRIKLAKIHVVVGSDDAAKTALLYGTISGAVSSLVVILEELTNLSKLKSSSIIIKPDFLSEKIDAKIHISLSISIWAALMVNIKTIIRYKTLKERAQAIRQGRSMAKQKPENKITVNK